MELQILGKVMTTILTKKCLSDHAANEKDGDGRPPYFQVSWFQRSLNWRLWSRHATAQSIRVGYVFTELGSVKKGACIVPFLSEALCIGCCKGCFAAKGEAKGRTAK